MNPTGKSGRSFKSAPLGIRSARSCRTRHRSQQLAAFLFDVPHGMISTD
jgi:hypothetical protein